MGDRMRERFTGGRTGAIGRRLAALGSAAFVIAALAVTPSPAGAAAGSPIVPVGPAGSARATVAAPRSPGASVEPGANGRIAFVSDRYASTPNIFTVDPTNPAAVSRLTGCKPTSCPGGALSPAWSPDGRLIAFVRDADGAGSGAIYEMFAGGGGQHAVGTLTGEWPTWSPDASQLAFASAAGGLPNEDIFVDDSGGLGAPVDISNDPASADLQPAWSPDGTRIAYVATDPNFGGATNVFVNDKGGTGTPLDVTNSTTPVQDPSWSPDGSKIAYDDGTGIFWVPSTGGGSPTPVVTPGTMPSWSADGTLIAYSTSKDGNPEIYTTTVDGVTQTRVTNDPNADYLPAFQSIQITIAASANIVHFKDPVTLTAHLNLFQQTTNLTVTIWKLPFTGGIYTVATGTVDGNGDFAKTIQVYNRTYFYATWTGDATHPPAQSSQRVVQVQSVTTGTLSGYYGTSGSYRLYHYTSQCVGSQHIGCPVYTVVVVPDSTGQNVVMTLQELVGSTWTNAGPPFSFALGNGSKIAVKLTYPNNGVIGHSFRIMAAFQGNGASLPSQSDWAYFKITT